MCAKQKKDDEIFPGIRLENSLEQQTLVYFRGLRELLPFNCYGQFPYWKRSSPVSESKFLNGHDTYFLMYDHPVHGVMQKIYICNREAVIAFLEERFELEWSSGIDLLIAPFTSHFSTICYGNHDGALFEVDMPSTSRNIISTSFAGFPELFAKLEKSINKGS